MAHQRGIELAVADHNSREDRAFRLALRTVDDTGDPASALRAADRLAADPLVVAVVGPTAVVLREDLVARYGRTRLAVVVVAAGSTTAEPGTALHLCVTRPLDRMLTPALISYLTRTRPARRILLVEDAADAVLGGEIAAAFREAAPAGATLLEAPMARGNAGFGVVARKAVSSRADAAVYAGGDASRAARLATALAGEGFTGVRVAAGPALGPAFLDRADEAAEGWVFAEAYADPSALPSARSFTAAHRKRFGAPPATWAAEAYDAVGLIADAAGTTSASGRSAAASPSGWFAPSIEGSYAPSPSTPRRDRCARRTGSFSTGWRTDAAAGWACTAACETSPWTVDFDCHGRGHVGHAETAEGMVSGSTSPCPIVCGRSGLPERVAAPRAAELAVRLQTSASRSA